MLNKKIGLYHITDDIIGSGSYSQVFKCYHTQTNKEYALKTIYLTEIPKMVKRIKEEIEVMKTLSHPNIVQLIDVYYMPSPENAKCLYMILEYCCNGDLYKFLDGKPLKESYAKYYIGQLKDGLRYLYNNKIIHRDLKPQNLVLNDKYELKITDFGFAKSFKENGYGMSETICGTPLYMAPEIMEYKNYSIKSDLWSVGVIMFEILVGKTPYNAKNHMDLLKNIHTKSIIFPNTIIITDDCRNLIIGLLRRNPSERIDWSEFFENKWFRSKCNHIPVKDSYNSFIDNDVFESNIIDPYNDSSTIINGDNKIKIIDEYDETIKSNYYSCYNENEKSSLQFNMDDIENKTPPLDEKGINIFKNKIDIFNPSISQLPNKNSGYVLVETPKEYNIISDILKNEHRQLTSSVINYMKGTYNFMKSICKN